MFDVIPRYDQILTRVPPYDDRDFFGISWDAWHGVRPSSPTDTNQARWLHDPVWNMITAGWHQKPKQRSELPVMYHVFLTAGRRGGGAGEFGVQPDGNLTIAEKFQISKQGASNVEVSSHGSPLSSSLCELRKSRSALMRYVALISALLPQA